MNRATLIGILVLGLVLAVSGQARRIRLPYGDYDCSCSYFCPTYGIKFGRCYDNDNYFGWGGHVPQYCCVPSYMDYDAPDQPDRFWRRR